MALQCSAFLSGFVLLTLCSTLDSCSCCCCCCSSVNREEIALAPAVPNLYLFTSSQTPALIEIKFVFTGNPCLHSRLSCPMKFFQMRVHHVSEEASQISNSSSQCRWSSQSHLLSQSNINLLFKIKALPFTSISVLILVVLLWFLSLLLLFSSQPTQSNWTCTGGGVFTEGIL